MKEKGINTYNLIRNWYNYKFDNPLTVKAKHSDMYFYIVDLCNRLGSKENFGLPTSVTMEALQIGSYNTYKNTLNDLIEFGFINLIKESTNQHQSKIVALSIFDKATDKALDKAHIKATDKATDKAVDSIDKQITKETNKQYVIDDYLKNDKLIFAICNNFNIDNEKFLNLFNEFKLNYIGQEMNEDKFIDAQKHFVNWLKIQKEKNFAPKKENTSHAARLLEETERYRKKLGLESYE